MNRREIAAVIAALLAGMGVLTSLVGAMIESGFGIVPLGEAVLAAGLITIFVCLGTACALCLVGLVKEWIDAR